MALWKCNVLKAEYNNLTGAASAVRRRLDAMPLYGWSPQDAAEVALMAGSAALNAIGSGVGVSVNVGYTYADGYSANAGVAQGGLVGRVSWS
ncbi:hypothetical protein EHQ13_06250, partial [Leptospira gomenensis]